MEAGVSGPPVPIRPLVAARNAVVIFRPLLLSGFLAEGSSKQFRIFCNCLRKDSAELSRLIEDPADEGRNLPARARFTIAHELAHTFFYSFDITGKAIAELDPSSDKDVQILEGLCDQAASHMLMPSHFLDPLIEKENLIDPATLGKLTQKFAVAPEATAIRIAEHRRWPRGRGVGLFVIRNERMRRRISVAKMDAVTAALFKGVEPGVLIKKLRLDDANLQLFGGALLKTKYTFKAEPEVQGQLWQHQTSESATFLTVQLDL